MLPTKLKVNCPFGSGDEVQNRFSRWPPWRSSWISDRNDFSLFLSTCHQMLPTEFRVNVFNGSGEEVQNRSRRWPPWRPYWISDRNNLRYFLSTCHPDASYQESNQSVQRFRIFDLGLTALSRKFHSYRADRSSNAGENRRSQEKPPDHPQAELGFPTCDLS